MNKLFLIRERGNFMNAVKNDDDNEEYDEYDDGENKFEEYMLQKRNVIWLNKEVSSETANDIINKILTLHEHDASKDIYMFINSPGGSVTDGMAIYDTMNFVSNNIVTVGFGVCASMGQFLLTAGTKGKRFLLPHTRVLMHQPSGGFGGTETDSLVDAKLIDDMRVEMAKITAERTGNSLNKILKDNEVDNWFTAQEAIKYGFADHIITSVNELFDEEHNN